MGLSGAAKKQRIQDDPRNLRWAQDTSAPGFKLLASMGWDPSSNPSLGNSESQAAIFANGGSAFSKKISSIPIAKEDNLGIGMKRGSAASVVGTLKAMGVPGGGIGAGAAKVSGFVTAGSGSSTPNGGGQGSSQGGEFGGLLARLNKMKEQGSLVATPIPSDTDSSKKRKRSGSASSSSSSSDSDSSDSDDEESKVIVETMTISQPVPEPAPISSYAAMLLKNPRMAARSKHLRAKRMATSENASAMAEILGLAPTPSPSSSGASTPNPHMTPALAIAPPSKEGWPVAPPRGTSAMVSTTTISTKGTGAAPSFTSAKTTTLEPTFDPLPSTSTSTEESDKARRKREKFEKKLAKEAKRALKEEKKKRLPSPPPSTRPPRSPSPEFRVHSAAHDPFHVTSETPVGDKEPPKKAAGVYASMFVSSKQGGMGATWDGDAGKLKETVEGDTKDVRVKEPVKEKKSKKDKSKKKRKAEEIEEVVVEPVGEAGKEERKETKEEKRARKEAKRLKKEAKRQK